VTVTGKRYTARQAGSLIDGVLFLTAGYGTRAEPLSISLPKCLFPLGDNTLLGCLIDQFSLLDPPVMAFNVSRCEEMVKAEVSRHWNGRSHMFFEERPLGAPGTLARNHEILTGNWVVCNTDFAMNVPVKSLAENHLSSGSSWTVLTGNMPENGQYGVLEVNGKRRHYLGVSVISSEIPGLAFEKQISTGFFSTLRQAAENKGIQINEYFTDAEWYDMGETELFRKHTLARGTYIHPTASVHREAILQGFYYLGPHCIIKAGALVKNSVLLRGVRVLPGASAIDTVLPAHFIKEP